MGNPYRLAIQEQTKEEESRLELCMPEEELPETAKMLRWANSIEPLSDESPFPFLSLKNFKILLY